MVSVALKVMVMVVVFTITLVMISLLSVPCSPCKSICTFSHRRPDTREAGWCLGHGLGHGHSHGLPGSEDHGNGYHHDLTGTEDHGNDLDYRQILPWL